LYRRNVRRSAILTAAIRVVELRRRMLRAGVVPCRKHQFRIQCPHERPAPHAAGKDIDESGQIAALAAGQLDVGDISGPDLIRERRDDVCDQIRPDRQPVAGIGRFWLVSGAFPAQAELSHDTLDLLLVDLPALALQLLGDFAVAVEGKFFKNWKDEQVPDPLIVVIVFFALFPALGT